MAKSKQVGRRPAVTPAPVEPVIETPQPEPQPEPEVATIPEPEPQPEPEAQPDHPAELMAALRASLAGEPEGGKTVEYGADGYVRTTPTPAAPAQRTPREPGQPRPMRVAVDEGRMAELVEEARCATVLKPTEEAMLYKRILAETGLKPAGLARAVCPEPRAEMGKLWDRIIWRGLLLDLDPAIQAAVDAGEIGAGAEVGELHRVPEERREELLAALKEGFKSRGAMRAFAAELLEKEAA